MHADSKGVRTNSRGGGVIMSLYDYITSQEISLKDYPFYALVMAR